MKELRFHEDTGNSDQDATNVINDKDKSNDVGYVNKGFNDSSSSKEELSNEVRSDQIGSVDFFFV